jgi:hypothetical protein
MSVVVTTKNRPLGGGLNHLRINYNAASIAAHSASMSSSGTLILI